MTTITGLSDSIMTLVIAREKVLERNTTYPGDGTILTRIEDTITNLCDRIHDYEEL